MKRLLLVSHRPLEQAGGATARWRAFCRYLPEHDWEVEVLSAAPGPGAAEFAELPRDRRQAAVRARVMSAIGRASGPAFALAGVRPEALPLSMAWIPRGAMAVRRRIAAGAPDVVVATGPPMAAPLAARLGLPADAPPLIVELRDLWAENPAFDRSGGLLGAIERRVVSGAAAVVACTPEAAADLHRRHPEARVQEVANGFDPELLRLRGEHPPRPDGQLTILHSGTLTADRPLSPLLRVLARERYRSRFRLVLQGFLAPPIAAEVAAADGTCEIEVRPAAPWPDAVRATAAAHVGLVSQAAGAGDATAVAAKVYEYLALGKPVLCLSDGGATEALLRRLGADRFCARLGDERSIAEALERLLQEPGTAALPPAVIAAYDRRRLSGELAAELERVLQD